MTTPHEGAVTFGGFRLDPDTESVWLDGEEIRLRPKTFAVLRYLTERPRRLVTKDELLEAVWSDATVGEAALAVCVREIRKSLGDDARTPRFIETVHRRGYRFIGGTATATRADEAALPASDTPLIGRESELVRLRRTLDEAWQRGGRTVAILGDGGIGKSRIVQDLATGATGRGGRLLIGRCYETEQILPFGPWVHAIRHGNVLHEIASGLPQAWRDELARLFPELGQPPAPADYAQNLRLFEAIGQVLARLTRPQPVLLLLEDVHWADEMSLRLVAFLARQIRSWPILMVVTARDEELPSAPLLAGLLQELAHDDRSLSLTLAPLSRAETSELVRTLGRACADEPALARLVEQMWTVSEGNPFLVVETMRAMQDGTVPPSFSSVPLPQRVRDILSARLARLSGRGQYLAAVASVIGREFDFSVLARATGLDEVLAAEGVEELVRRRVLRGSGERFDFSHDRIREVAYGQLLPPRRRLLHAQVAAAIEDVYRGALEPHAAALAAHCCHGELWEKALDYLRRAGNSAVACSATRDAIAYFEQALRVLEHLPEGRSRDEHTHDLRMSLGAACYSLGEFARIVEHLDAAEALTHVRDDEVRLGRMAVLRLGCFSTMGDQAAAIEAGQRGLALAEATGNRPRQAVASVMLGFSHLGRGDFPRAITFLRKSASLLQEHPEHARFNQIGLPAVFWRTWLIFSLGELGAFAEANTRGEEAVAIAEAADQPFSVAEANGAIGHLHTLKGELALAVPALERSVAVCRDYKLAVLSPLMIGALGRAYALCGRLADALPTMEEAVAMSDALGTMWWQARRVTNLGEGYLRAGRVDDAVTTAEKALALAEIHDERGNRAYALRLLGDIAHHRGDFADARGQLSRALALATELGMEPLVAHCHAGLGAVERRTGGRERAAEHFDAATAMYRRMDMRRPEDGAGGHGDV